MDGENPPERGTRNSESRRQTSRESTTCPFLRHQLSEDLRQPAGGKVQELLTGALRDKVDGDTEKVPFSPFLKHEEGCD